MRFGKHQISLEDWRNQNVTYVSAVHSNHLSAADREQFKYASPHADLYKHLDSADLVVTLTESQRNALQEQFISAHRNVTISNALGIDPVPKPSHRDPGAGVMLAQLDANKRVDHTIRATQLVRERFADVHLGVFGVGPDEARLHELVISSNAQDVVALRGYANDGPARFRSYSFSLLTSESEGQPLVLLESMASGCIPIAYDIDYGPSDIITDGENGFLVPSGDVSALADRIERIYSMPEKEIRKMQK